VQADQIALQLYTVRERAAADLQGTLRALAEIGYTAVEFAGYQGVPVADLRATLDELGMRAMGAHVQYDLLDSEPDRALDEVQTLGGDFVIVPHLAEGLRGDLDAVHRVAETFNAWGERCRAAGLTFAYHNHAFEFAPLPGADGATMYDVLVARTDPALVYLELDVFWVMEGGVDPLELLRRHPGRIPLLHVKDKDASDGSDAPVGAGTIAWQPVLDAAEAGARWYVVEQDHPKDPMADVATSLRNLKAMASPA
jgi:sugar phosphate isomerase/epimerase